MEGTVDASQGEEVGVGGEGGEGGDGGGEGEGEDGGGLSQIPPSHHPVVPPTHPHIPVLLVYTPHSHLFFMSLSPLNLFSSHQIQPSL